MMPQLARVAERYSVPVYSCGGFASLSAVHEIVKRAKRRAVPTVFLHVGDYDPSGESIFECDDRGRGGVSGRGPDARHFAVHPRARRAHRRAGRQVRAPTAPAKASDSRSARWSGETCQLEALPPDVLAETVEAAIRGWFDLDLYAEHREFERQERIELLRALPAGNGDAEASA